MPTRLPLPVRPGAASPKSTWCPSRPGDSVVRAREVNRRIERAGGRQVAQRGSHRKYRVVAGTVSARTTVPQHPGDLPPGTLRAIERDLEPALGKGWLLR